MHKTSARPQKLPIANAWWPAMLNYLRIAVTVLSLTACVLLVALWVRSYWWHDGMRGPLPGNHTFSLSAAYGRVRYATFDKAYQAGFTGKIVSGWRVSTERTKSPPNLKLVNTPLTDLGLGFAHSSDRYGIVAVFPIWFPVILSGALAAVPWTRHVSWRFSLRTLLIATTLIAVVLGIVAISN